MPAPTAHALYGRVQLGTYSLSADEAIEVAASLLSASNEATGLVAEGVFA